MFQRMLYMLYVLKRAKHASFSTIGIFVNLLMAQREEGGGRRATGRIYPQNEHRDQGRRSERFAGVVYRQVLA